uniref:Claudin n=1 Tax=Astyanax mexicanus TaxID=7994 RepID=A0A8B9J5C9_ASTMX
MSAGLQMLGAALGMLGWLGVIVACALPLWRVTAFIGNNIVTSQVMWEGLWMNCVVQSTGQMQCKVFDSMLALPQDLQASRAILVIAIVIAVVAILASLAGAECTNCLDGGSTSKAKVAVGAGIFFLVAGLLSLVPPSWTANVVIKDFYNPLVSQAQKRELGAAIFICWGAGVLQVIGGGLLCTSWPRGGGMRGGLYKPASQTREHTAYV